jgi:hypothetical protein
MHLQIAPLTPARLDLCVPFWGGLSSYTCGERHDVFDTASRLLDEQRAIGALVMENERARAFGITVFADESYLDRYWDDPRPQIGKALFLDAARGGSKILTREEIGERNAGTGGQLVIANCGWNPEGGNPELIFARVVESTFQTLRGYRIARLLNESFGQRDIALLINSEYEIQRVFDEIAPGVPVPSAIGTLTCAQAFDGRKGMLPLFAYTPPRIFFTSSEQQLLAAALSGWTDESLSAHLRIPLTAVKGRWTRIQRRAADALPELFDAVAPSPFQTQRGPQWRHVLLQYLRDNPSELTPYQVPGTTRRAPHANTFRPASSVCHADDSE